MTKRKKSSEILAEVKKERLNKHLNEVAELIEKWIFQLSTPNPFYWSESKESQDFGKSSRIPGPPVPSIEQIQLEPWKLWACRCVYVPPLEQDAVSNHILRKHLRKRALWSHHTEWEERLNKIRGLAAPVYAKATKMRDERSADRELTEDYEGIALQAAFELVLGHTPAKSYSQRLPQGVWYEGILIEKSANAQQMNKVTQEHWQMVSELGQSREMLELAQEWQQVLDLQEKMQELAKKALKSSDFLYPCQFCRRLW
jgi:hypothetical protein